jgi:hypothetical protein
MGVNQMSLTRKALEHLNKRKQLHHARQALNHTVNELTLKMDDEVRVIRRNLLFVSTLAFFALNISLNDKGTFEVNLGIISGELIYPNLIYVGLLLALLYHSYHFYVEISAAAISGLKNMSNIHSQFIQELCKLWAASEWSKLTRQYDTVLEVSFESRDDAIATQNESAIAYAKMEEQKIQGSELANQLIENRKFELETEHGMTTIKYVHHLTPTDIIFLHVNRQRFWVFARKSLIQYHLPLLTAAAASILLLKRLFWL